MREVDRDVRLGAKRLQNDVASLADLGLFGGELASFHESLHERLVLGELLHVSAAHHVGPTVADLHHEQTITQQSGDRGRRAHSAVLGVFPGVLMDAGIGEDRGVAERGGEGFGRWVGRLPRFTECRKHQRAGHAAGQFA